MRVFCRTFTALCVLLLTASPALAQGTAAVLQPYNNIGFYEVSWSGLTVGGLVIAAQEDETRYRMDTQVKSNGLAWAFTKHESQTMVEGLRRGERYIPQHFETLFKLRGKTRNIRLGYAADGKLTEEFMTPPDDPAKRPPPTQEEKQYALDPLTTLFAQRQKAHAALRKGESSFTLRMFDGRRLTDMHYHVQQPRQITWNRQHVAVIPVNVSRTPIGGYKASELRDISRNKDPLVNIYLSHDEALLPLKMEISGSIGNYYANLKRRCTTLEECAALLK